jgi:hypothetical protein
MATVDPIALRVKLGVAALLGGLWIFLIFAPLCVIGTLSMPPVAVWCLFGTIFGYFVYTGIRAWHRGWKSRFILRVAVPIALLTLSSISTAAWLWLRT